MGLIFELRQATDAQIATLIADPPLIHDFLDEEDDGTEPLFERFTDDEICIDKAWHGIHYLLTGTDWSGDPLLDFVLSGGVEIGFEDVGYGLARALTSAEVAVVSRALTAITADTLRARYDPVAMMEDNIYPNIWDHDPAEDDLLGYLIENFELLKAFCARTTASGRGLVVYLC